MDFDTPPRGRRGQPSWRPRSSRTTAPPSDSVPSTPGTARFDHELWRRSATPACSRLTVPEEHDGSGLGLLELCSVLVEVGRTVAPVPAGRARRRRRWRSRAFGTPTQQARWLPARGLGEFDPHHRPLRGPAARPAQPVTRADNDGSQLAAHRQQGGGPRRHAGRPVRRTRRDRVRADRLPGALPTTRVSRSYPQKSATATWPPGSSSTGAVGPARPRARRHRRAAPRSSSGSPSGSPSRLCASSSASLEGALSLTAEYAKTREQFGRPIGTFQAVSQRLADGYIDVLGAG